MLLILLPVFFFFLIIYILFQGVDDLSATSILSLLFWSIVISILIVLLAASFTSRDRDKAPAYRPKRDLPFHSTEKHVFGMSANVIPTRNHKVLQLSLDGNEVPDLHSEKSMPLLPETRGYSERFNIVLPDIGAGAETSTLKLLEWESTNGTMVKVSYVTQFGTVLVNVVPRPGIVFVGSAGLRPIYGLELSNIVVV